MKTLSQPTSEFNLEVPSYEEVAKTINYMRSGASGCPNDQISIIVLKNRPITRTMMWKIIAYCWPNKLFPKSVEKWCHCPGVQKR